MTRKGRQDALNPSPYACWLVVRNRLSVAIEWEALAPEADLRAAMAAERARKEADGWTTDPIPHYCACFFCSRGDERVRVTIECVDPSTGRLRP